MTMKPWIGIIAAVACYTGQATAQDYQKGDRVQASPMWMDSDWQECEIVDKAEGDSYTVLCGPGRYQYAVSQKWIRPAPAPVQKPPADEQQPALPATSTSRAQDKSTMTTDDSQGEGVCRLGARVVNREGKTGTVIVGGKVKCQVKLDDGSEDRGYYLAWMLSPLGKDGKKGESGGGSLEKGIYVCSAAAGIAGIFRLTVKSRTQYASSSGKTGSYRMEPKSGSIVFESGQFKNQFGKRLGPGKFGISSDQDGFFSTVCNLQ